MKLVRLHLQNFMSYSKAKVDLLNQGVVLVTGQNLDSKALNNNGSGKSSLWDALLWVLYGKTLREVTADEIINERTSGGTTVGLTLLDDKEREWKIVRTRGVKSSATLDLFCEGKSVTSGSVTNTQKRIDGLIGLDYETFAKAAVFDLDSLRFARLSDKEKKAVLEKLLGLEVYERALYQTRQEIAGQKISLELSNTTYAKARERLEEARKRKAELLQKKQIEQKQIDVNIEETKKKIEIHKKGLDECEDRIGKLENRLLKYKQAEDRLHQLQNEATDYKERYESLAGEIESLQNQIIEAKEKKDSTCSVCHQSLERPEAKKAFIKSIEDRRDALATKLSKLARNYREVRAEAKRARKNIKHKKIQKLNKLILAEKEGRNQLSSRITSLEAQIDLARTSRNYSQGALDEVKKIIKDAKREMEGNSGEVNKIEHKIALRKFWEAAFGQHGIRSLMMNTVVPFLNDRANYYSQSLTDGAIKIKFSTSSALGDGRIVDRFSISVRNKDGSKVYGANSGGERQRIDLCIALALKDLARSRTNRKIDLMVFDEVFERVDASGCDRIIELLNRERNNFGSCFVITHNDSLKQYFPKRLEVVKENGISRIEYAG